MKFSKAIFYASCAALIFCYGLVVGAYEVFPYKALKFALNSLESVVADRDNLMGNKPVGFLAERRYEGSGVTRNELGRVAPGLTLLSGFFEDLPELRLISQDGSIVQRWPVSYLHLFPDSEHILPQSDVPASDWNAAIHGMEIASDGAVVFNFDGKGTVKLDRCGKRLWAVAQMTHHSIDRGGDGSYWIPSRNFVQDKAQYPLFQVPYRDDTILRVSGSGDVLSETPVVKVLIDNGLYALLVANGLFDVIVTSEDLLHINDIEELSADDAPAFGIFAAGDLLVSMRHLNLLMVVEPGTWRIKWHQVGPWLRQHDPDFHADGTITVFNNNSDDTKRGEILAGSQIVAVRPTMAGRNTEIVYGAGPGQRFFTNTQGKHQRLPNGNWLIAEYYAGRVIEIDRAGEIVWEYINQYDSENVAKISGAMRYPPDYFEVTDWGCESR